MKNITYEIRFYRTKKDFVARKPTTIEEGYTTKKMAMSHAKILGDEYEVVKVQSSDREFIKILGDVE